MNNNKQLLTLGAALLPIGAMAQQAEKPNIIFILCDDMGYGDLGCYGQQYISTPIWTTWQPKACVSRKPMPAVR